MKKSSKEFLGVMLSVLISVFMVYAIIYATTTVGNDITVGTDLTVTSGARIGNSVENSHITVLGDGTLFVEGDAEFDGTVYFDSSVAIMGTGTAEPATEFSVVGTASISQDVWASGSFQFGGGEDTATASYSRLGAATTAHALSNPNDLLVSGSLEVGINAFFDGNASLSDSSTLFFGGVTIAVDTTSPSAACVLGSLHIESDTGIFSYCDIDGNWSPVDDD